jgi:hypothetical protein
MPEYLQLIADEAELKWFYDNIMPPLGFDDVYYVSLSARAKYLTEDEKREYKLGKNEMFNRAIIREQKWETFLRTIRKYECDSRAYITKNGKVIPPKTIVCYVNLNPLSATTALYLFGERMNKYSYQRTRGLMRGFDTTVESTMIQKAYDIFMTCFKEAQSGRYWIDIDMDIDKEFEPFKNSAVLKWLEDNKIDRYYFIDTRSGYHLLLDKVQLSKGSKKGTDPNKLAEVIAKEYMSWLRANVPDCEFNMYCDETEIKVNENGMIPLAGTYQSFYPVTVINKGTV